jgi:subtilisin family serine protease
VKRSTIARLTKELLITALLGSVAVSLAADKRVRLRSEIIATPEADKSPAGRARATEGGVASGLFLVQFEDQFQPAWKGSLRAMGVELVRYVPDDAFVARFDNVRVNAVRALPFVRWVGEFRPDHKIHPRLKNQAQGKPAREALAVSVLLSPLASPAEAAEAQRTLPGASRTVVPRLGTILRGQVPAGQVTALAQSSGILWIEPAPQVRLYDEVSSRIVAGDGAGHDTAMMDLGYDGAGVTVAVADSGLDSGEIDYMHPDLAGRVKALLFYGGLEDAADEHGHGTHVAGIIAGNGATGEIDENDYLYGLGVAPGAELVVQRLFDGRGAYYAPPTYETLTREARQAGADIGSNSWGDDTQGAYDLSAAEFDALVRDADLLTPGDQPYILEFSAGNAGGYQTIGSPAVGKNVIATGASQNNRFNLPIEEFTIYADGQDAMADFSSRGPCEDGRIKPDVVAPGTWIASLRSIYADDENAWWPISDNYFYMSGTSMAGPQVSGAAAVFVQYFRATHTNATPSPALVKAALINSATDMDDGWGTGPTPNMDEGWGRVDLPQLIGRSQSPEFLDQAVPLAQGQVFEYRVVIDSDATPLKITLAYTDVPGFPGSPVALVNDLDLEVIGPDGLFYRGNQFEEGESVPNAPSADNINNVEGVYLAAPLPGEYVVRVRARQVVEDARADTPADDQDFALVISASIAPPGNGILTFDRPAYTVPGLIKLTLVDHNLAGQTTVDILLQSTTEPTGEVITLRSSGVTGLFTANVATATGPPVPDGQLHIRHGDSIEALYEDALPPATRTFTARADLLPPVIANVGVSTRFGRTFVSFSTDEDAVSSVRYGTNGLSYSATNRFFDTVHELALTNVFPNLPYRFLVIAEDAAGNRATNGPRSFTAEQSPTVLLVDAYTDMLFSVPPLTGYTDPLDRLGVSYEIFDATAGDSPTLADLRPYRCVIWRLSEFQFPELGGTTIYDAQVQALTNYLAGGGSLLIASMEFLSRLPGDGFPNFARDWLQVGGFVEDTGVSSLTGASGDPMGSGINSLLDYAAYEDSFKEDMGIPVDVSDTIAPTTNAAPVFYDGFSVCGVRSPKPGVDLPGRVVFLSFPLDAVPLGSGVGNNRAGLLRNILNFLAPPEGNSTIALDSDRYTVPNVAVVEVEDHDLEGQGQTTVTFYSPRQPSGVTVTLRETVRRGLFRGSVALVPAGGGSGGPALVVQAGDAIRADYLDVSANTVNSATAVIEITPPAITGVGSEPDYVAAFVWWDTSEPADALVQFSDTPENLSPTNSFPINSTAYDPSLDTYHELLLQNLLPNHTYYFRVVSRDKAGNVAVDDNGGQYYIFTTLQPVSLPWTDDLEQGLGDWTVISAEGSERDWTLGTPGGGVSAHSPSTCWGSNLGGAQLGLAESVLVSPGIFLAGGNEATLRVWQNYDFLTADTEIEFGEVWLITNATTGAYVTLDTLGTIWGGPSDSSFGWEEVEYDLTPYLGTVVYVAWHYFVVGDDLERQGWLVDDISVEVGQAGRGTIQVNNNLAQAFVVVTGPVSRSGVGQSLVISNAPPGEYVVHFGAVPYYDLPAPQTQTLQASNVLVFHGNYVFTDSNQNGISDLWEQQYFGSAAPGHLPSWDSDGDGVSDYDEFVAGTNPTNSASVLRASFAPPTNGVAQLSWKATGSRAYRVLGSDDLLTWVPLTDWLHAPRSSVRQPVAIGPDVRARFFRLEVQP